MSASGPTIIDTTKHHDINQNPIIEPVLYNPDAEKKEGKDDFSGYVSDLSEGYSTEEGFDSILALPGVDDISGPDAVMTNTDGVHGHVTASNVATQVPQDPFAKALQLAPEFNTFTATRQVSHLLLKLKELRDIHMQFRTRVKKYRTIKEAEVHELQKEVSSLRDQLRTSGVHDAAMSETTITTSADEPSAKRKAM